MLYFFPSNNIITIIVVALQKKTQMQLHFGPDQPYPPTFALCQVGTLNTKYLAVWWYAIHDNQTRLWSHLNY